MLALALSIAALAAPPVEVTVDRDNVEINVSSMIHVGPGPIVDADGNGVIHITGDDISVVFLPDTRLHGAADDRTPDAYEGIGVVVTGERVFLDGLNVSGYKVGVRAIGANGLTIRACDVSGNFRQRLRSTPVAEDTADWLQPHGNDDHEWMTRYGAGIYVEDASEVSIHRVRARRGQNGIVLDRVTRSRIYDNDCSFLSGWGLAMWRSSRNIVCRNAFDFCVRGYSHGVYNRGQDSAGILLFEQCRENVIVENSATHGGDGFFAFSGREALGEASAPGAADARADARADAWYHERGNVRNVIAGNDFSYAAAHGLELTFGFANQVLENRLVGNAICGIWGGYSQGTIIHGNTFAANGDAGYGSERGGVNIEHGHGNVVRENTFDGNACGVFLWWDDDEHLMKLPWARVNERGSSTNAIVGNTFRGDTVAVQLRRSTNTWISGNAHEGVKTELDADDESRATIQAQAIELPRAPLRPPAIGEATPVGARAARAGREHIVMTEWGPYDWAHPRLVYDGPGVDDEGRPHLAYRLLGPEPDPRLTHDGRPRPGSRGGPLRSRRGSAIEELAIVDDEPGVLARVRIIAWQPGIDHVTVEYERPDGTVQVDRRTLVHADWTVRQFASPVDPRQDTDAWRAAGTAPEATVTHGVPALDLRFGMGGPAPEAAPDHFGTIATATVPFPPGRWRLRTTSDDGVRVWVDGTLAIDDWTWHAPKRHEHVVEVTEARDVALRVEHFELDGYAILALEIERIR